MKGTRPEGTPITPASAVKSTVDPASIYSEADYPMLKEFLEKRGALDPDAGKATVTGPAQAVVTGPALLGSTIKVSPPPVYEGDPEGLKAYLHSVKFYLVASGISLDSEQAVGLCAMRLGGKVATWFYDVTDLAKANAHPPILTFAEFSRVLTEYIQPVIPYQRYYDEFYRMQQGKNQTVKDFIAQFNKARARLPEPLADTPLRHRFLGALHAQLQQQIVVHQPQSFAQCLELANTLTDLSNSVSKPQHNGTHSGSGKTSSNGKVVCAHCGKPYHTDVQCWEKHPELRPKSSKAKDPTATKGKDFKSKKGVSFSDVPSTSRN